MEVEGVVDQKKPDDEHKDPGVWSKANKADMVGTMKAIEEYLRSCHGAMRAPFAYIIRKTIVVDF